VTIGTGTYVFYGLNFGFGVISKNVIIVTALKSNCSSLEGNAYSKLNIYLVFIVILYHVLLHTIISKVVVFFQIFWQNPLCILIFPFLVTWLFHAIFLDFMILIIVYQDKLKVWVQEPCKSTPVTFFCRSNYVHFSCC
jgi:hypothetical protein